MPYCPPDPAGAGVARVSMPCPFKPRVDHRLKLREEGRRVGIVERWAGTDAHELYPNASNRAPCMTSLSVARLQRSISVHGAAAQGRRHRGDADHDAALSPDNASATQQRRRCCLRKDISPAAMEDDRSRPTLGARARRRPLAVLGLEIVPAPARPPVEPQWPMVIERVGV